MGVEEERAAREMPVLEANDKTQSNIDVREHRRSGQCFVREETIIV